ncbi:MAG: FmdB family zinc ribbon protein [Bacteroidales bacterium]
MPLYEYQCDACGATFEMIHQRFSDPPVDTCRVCGGGPVHKLLSAPAIQFKGSGWYVTDYAKKSMTDARKADAAESSSASPASDKAKETPKDTPKASTDTSSAGSTKSGGEKS